MFPELVAIVTAASPVVILSAAILVATADTDEFKLENVIRLLYQHQYQLLQIHHHWQD
tara:strand:+ start:582 stop:755 length:174 start_codon:yes stop_codon:yes gene_type:complete